MYMSWQLDPKWWVGVGVSVPFGLGIEYGAGWFGRFQVQEAEIKTIDINPSVAYKLSDAVSIGGGLSFQRAEVTIDRSALVTPGVERASKLKLENDSIGFNLGAMFNLSPATRIGLSYRSSIKHDLEGTATVNGVGVAPISTTAKLPDTLAWGISHQLDPKWQLLSDITFTQWSKIKQVPITTTAASVLGPAGRVLDTFAFEFKNTFRVGVGANYQMRDDFMLKLGVAYDKSPVSDTFRTATLPDNDRTWLAIGGKYMASKQLTLDFGYSYIMVKDASINSTKALQGSVVGNYSDPSVHIISAQATYSF